MSDKLISIIDNDGQLVEITAASYIEQGVTAGLFDEDVRAMLNRRALWSLLGMCNALLVSLDRLAADKSEPNIEGYKEARRKIETNIMYHRFNEGETDPAEDPRIVRNDVKSCTLCGGRIVWMNGTRGMVPVDASTVYDGSQTYNFEKGHIIHFSTCTKRIEKRKK